MQMARIVGPLIVGAMLFGVVPARAQQSDPRQRQAAAEAYDQGTAAYVAGDYEKAAEWFETANRMSPAAPALIQAARAHQQAGHSPRAATLALRLTTEYASDPTAVQVGQSILDQLETQLVRIDVSCDGCTLDVDGALQERPSLFVEPGTTHEITASFESGERKATVNGQAGETKTLSFTAPPPPVGPVIGPIETDTGTKEAAGKPLRPLYTFIGGGVTGALLIASIVSTIDMNSGVTPYENAAKAYNSCSPKGSTKCNSLYDDAKSKLDAGQGKQTRTTIFWVATGVTGAATAAIALLLTNWSGKPAGASASERGLSIVAGPTEHGATATLKGRF